jgi:hypothetical protein
MALRDIFAHFGVDFDDKALKAGNSAITSAVEGLKGLAIATGGALMLGAIKNFVSDLTGEIAELDDQSRALGVSTQGLQEWQYAAKMSGAEAGELNAGLKKLSVAVEKGAPEFKKLGIQTKDASGNARPLLDVMGDTADAVGKIEDPTKRTATAMALFGKGGAKLIPLFASGREEIDALRAEVTELGFAFSEDLVGRAAEVDDQFDRLRFLWKGMQVSLLERVLPAVQQFAVGLISFGKRVVQVRKALFDWIGSTNLIKAALVSLGISGVVALSAKLGGLGAAFARLGKFAFRVILPFLLIEDALSFLNGDASLLGDTLEAVFGKGTSDNIRKFASDVKNEVAGLFDDFSKRPDKLLDDWNVFTTALRNDVSSLFGPEWGVWMNGVIDSSFLAIDILTGGWDNAGNKISAVGSAIMLAFGIAWTEIKYAGLYVAAALSDAFDAMMNGIRSGMGSILEVVAKVPKLSSALGLGGADLGKISKELKTGQGGTAREDLARAKAADKSGLVNKYDAVSKQLSAPAYAPAPQLPGVPAATTTSNTAIAQTVNNVITVQGTPTTSTINQMGAGVAAGARKGVNNAALASASFAPRSK